MIQYMRPLEDSVRVTPLFAPSGGPCGFCTDDPFIRPSDAPCGFGTDGPFIRPSGGPRSLYQRGYAPRMEVVDLVRVAVKYGVQKICHNCRIIVRFARQK